MGGWQAILVCMALIGAMGSGTPVWAQETVETEKPDWVHVGPLRIRDLTRFGFNEALFPGQPLPVEE